MQSLLCNLCCAIFVVQSLLCNLCCATFVVQSLSRQTGKQHILASWSGHLCPDRRASNRFFQLGLGRKLSNQKQGKIRHGYPSNWFWVPLGDGRKCWPADLILLITSKNPTHLFGELLLVIIIIISITITPQTNVWGSYLL